MGNLTLPSECVALILVVVVAVGMWESVRLRAELARVTMERDILGKATAYFAKGQK